MSSHAPHAQVGIPSRCYGLALLLSIVSSLLLAPGTAYAADKFRVSWSFGPTNMSVASQNFDSVAALNKKMDSSDVGSHIWIKLEEDFKTMPGGLRLPADKTVEIDLNGHVLGRDLSKAVKNGYVVEVGKRTKLTVKGGAGLTNNHFMWDGQSRVTGTSSGGVITGGYSTNTSGGIQALKGSRITLDNATIAGCATTAYGGGIRADGSDITIIMNNANVKGCHAGKDGGGIYGDNSGLSLSLSKSLIQHNHASRDGGGVATDGAAKIGGKESGVNSNMAGSDGGGLHCTGGGTTVRNLTIDGNTSTNTGGGIYLHIISSYKPTNPSNVLSNLTIKNNKTTGQYGGGIWCGSDNAILDACVVEGNTASLWGGGVYLVTNATDPGITLAGSLIIRNNTAAKNPDLSLASSAVGDLVFLLKRPAEVRLGLAFEPHDNRRLSTYKRGVDCTKYLHLTSGNDRWHIEFNKNGRETWLKKGATPNTASATIVQAADAMVCTDTGRRTESGYPLYRGYVRFPNVGDGAKDMLSAFYYSDGFFAGEPATYDPHLATTSLAMAMSGFYLNAGGVKDYTNKHASARQFMASIGCADDAIYVNDFNVQKPWTNTIGVTIAHKMLKDIDGKETGEILIPVAIRGAGIEAEWSSNMTIGDGTSTVTGKEAQGFAEAASQVCKSIEYYLKDRGLEDKMDKVCFWVVGYSRAGATANLTSKRLIERYGGERAKVFGYTFEAPQGAVDNEQEKYASAYYSIHNVINYADIVPLLGPSAMGFKRYGVDHYVPGGNAGSVRTSSIKPTRQGKSGVNTVTTYCDNDHIETTSPGYTATRDNMVKQLALVDPGMGFDDYFMTAGMYINSVPVLEDNELTHIYEKELSDEGKQLGVNEEKYIRDLIENVQKWSIKDRDVYVRRQQHAFREIMRIMLGMSPKNAEGFMGSAAQMADLFSMSDRAPFASSCFLNWNTLPLDKGIQKWYMHGLIRFSKEFWGRKAWTNFFLDSLEKSGALDFVSESDKNQIKRIFPTLFDFVMTIASSDSNTKSYNSYNNMMMATLIHNMSRIMANHYPEVNLAWLRSYDTYYKDENSAYRLAAPESVAAPVAKVGSRKLADNELLAGSQAISLEVEGLKGEAIYYKLTKNGANAIAKPACANGYEIYRGPLDLSFGLNDTYVITAYAMSFGVKSPETTITLRGRDGNHVVNVTNGVSSTPSKYTLREQMTRTVSASVPDQRFFKAWEITDENGKDVSKLVRLGEGQTLKSEKIDFTLPEGGKDGLSANYELNVKATFVPLADALTVGIAGTPDELPDRELGRTVGITYTYNNKKYSERVPATWAYKNVEGTFVSTSLKYAKSTYRLTLDLSAAQSKRFVGDVSALKVDFAKTGYKVVEVKRGQDQTLSIVCEFETDKSDYAQPAIFYSVTIEHYDYNTKKKLVGVADQKLKVEANARQEYVLDAPIVKDASFTEWGADTASGIEVAEPGSDAFKVTKPLKSDGTLTVRAYYVPVVKAVTMSLDEPRANSELNMDPRAAYEISGAFPRPDGYSQEAYPLVSADVTWYDSDGKQVTGIAASDEAYHAKVTPRVSYPSPWTCVFAGDVALRYSGGATWVWDSEGWEAQSKSAYVYFPHTNSKHHKVTVFDGEDGSELLTTDGYEGDFLTLKPGVPDGMVFWKWSNPHYNTGEGPDREYSTEIPGLAVRWSPDNAITLRIPKAGETLEGGDGRRVAETYALWIDAHFLDKRQGIDISLPTPGSTDALELVQSASASIAWPGADGTGNTLSQDVRVRWSRETKGGDVACGQTVVYANSAYTAELDLSKDLSDRLVDRPTVNMVDGKDASRKWDNVSVSRNGDGTLHVSATYTTAPNEGMTVEDSPATVTVNVVAANINDKGRAPLAQETYTFVEDVTTECEFVVSPPDVLGAVFTEWDVPADGNVVHIANDEQGQDGVYDESAATDAGYFKIEDATRLGDEHVVTVYALVRPIVNKVVVEMAKPEAGSQALPDKSKIKAHLTYANTELFKGELVSVPESVAWSPEVGKGQTVAFHTEYVAELTFKETDPNAEFAFDDNCDVYHATGENLVEDLGTYVDYGYNFEDDSFTATLYFEHSDAAKLIHVADPEWVEGVPYTDDVSDIQSMLPTHADIVTSDPTVEYAEIDWQTPELIEDGKDADDEEVIYQSVWQASGKVRIPENVLNPDDVDTNVATLVVVEPPVDDKEYAEMPYTTLEPGEYATEQEIGLVAGEENGTVYYMVGLDDDEFKEYKGELIELNDGTLDKDGILAIYAFTACEGKEPSPVVGFVYGLTTQLEVPLGEVHTFNSDNQIGVIGGKGYTLEAGEGVTIDEDGNACARNVGEYTVTAKLKDGFSWRMDEDSAQEEQVGDENEPEFVKVDGTEFEETTRKDQTITFVIEPASFADDVEVDDIEDQGYTSSAVTPEPVVTIDGNVLEKDVDYTLVYSNNKDAGTATVKIIGKDNVTGERSTSFEIKKITVTYNKNAEDATGVMDPTETGPNVETPLRDNAFAREGWVFDGWNDRADGTGEAYHEGEPVRFDADTTLFAQWTKQTFPLAVFSRDEASGASVADVSVEPALTAFEEGSEVSVRAPAKAGWAFVGWFPVTKVEQGLVSEYDDQAQLSNQRTYSFTVTGKTAIVAVYRAAGSGNARITINSVNGARYTIARNGVRDPNVQQGSQHNVRIGTVLSITAADGGRVVHWLNGNGKVMGKSQDSLEYTVTGDETISVIYDILSNEITQVSFMNDFDQVLMYRRYAANTTDADLIEFPEPPAKLGYTFKRWVFKDTGAEATGEAILQRVQHPEASHTQIIVRPEYEHEDRYGTVAVFATDAAGEINEEVSRQTYRVGEAATLVAQPIKGWTFESWRSEAGEILGYTDTYSHYVSGDCNLIARYVDDQTSVERVPVISITGFARKVEAKGAHVVQCLLTRSVPEGYELVEHGVLYGANLGGLTEDTFVRGAKGVVPFVFKNKDPVNTAVLHVPVRSDDVNVYFRAFAMVRRAGSDEIVPYYSDIEAASFSGIN